MRWVELSALSLGLLFAPSLRAERSAAPPSSEGAQRAKSLPLREAGEPDVFALACERARQISLQGLSASALPPPQTSPRFVTLDTVKGAPAGVVYAWAVPDARSPFNRALAVVAQILAGDLVTGLNHELVFRRRLATLTKAWLLGLEGTDLFAIQVAGMQPGQIDQVEAAVQSVLARLAAEGPEQSELERAVAWLELELAEKAAGRPELSEFAGAYRAVRGEDVRGVVLRFLTAERKTTVEVRPRGSPEPKSFKPADVARPSFRLHTIRKGETLKAIAARHGVKAETIAKRNGLGKNASPYVGQTLTIPRAPRVTTQKVVSRPVRPPGPRAKKAK